jgi:hypothetical protein
MDYLHDSLRGLSARVHCGHREAEVIACPDRPDHVDPAGGGLDRELPDSVVGDGQETVLDAFVGVVVGGGQLKRKSRR